MTYGCGYGYGYGNCGFTCESQCPPSKVCIQPPCHSVTVPGPILHCDTEPGAVFCATPCGYNGCGYGNWGNWGNCGYGNCGYGNCGYGNGYWGYGGRCGWGGNYWGNRYGSGCWRC